VGKIEEGLEALIAEGFMEPQPIKSMARLINGVLLEAAFFVATSEDPRPRGTRSGMPWSVFWAAS
jgi:Tetracyclin repressor-like, C-terminal domain